MAGHMKQAQGGFSKYAIKIWHLLYKCYRRFRINLREMVSLSLGQREQERKFCVNTLKRAVLISPAGI
jgi:hypothetical protein